MSDPARPDPPHPETGTSLESYKPYLALFGIAAAGVALLVVVGGIALAIFMKAGWVLVPLACAIWTLFPLRDLQDLEDGAGLFAGAAPGGSGSGLPDTGPDATGIGPVARGGGGASTPAVPGDATRETAAGEGPSAGASGTGAPPGGSMARRRAAWDVVRQRAVNALLITFTAWAALILLHLI